ncbi:MAG: hypothetical protein M1822_009968 [Bathelium mastoideum]|nr:MAG: hypothetical protein M1822_009968 [Bathelium mastoideum]
MSSTTAVVNPLDTTEALLFYVTTKQNLALESRRLNISSYEEFIDNFSPDWVGLIQQPGHIAAVKHDRSVVVYGFTKSPNNEKEDAVWISQISPIINILSSYENEQAFASTWRVLAATTDGHANDWIYFFRDEDVPKDPSNPKPIIMQFSSDVKSRKVFSAGHLSESDILGVVKPAFPNARPRITTRIAAFYDETAGSSKRHTVFFQRDAATPSIYYQFADSEAPIEIDHTGDAVDGTPIATVNVPDPKDRILSMYYVNNGATLQRMNRVNETWTAAFEVNTDFRKGSGLTAVWDSKNKLVQLFFQTNESGDKIIQVSDDPSQMPC